MPQCKQRDLSFIFDLDKKEIITPSSKFSKVKKCLDYLSPSPNFDEICMRNKKLFCLALHKLFCLYYQDISSF